MLILLLSAACSQPADTGAVVCGTHSPTLGYSNFGEGFLLEHCAGCHSSMLPADARQGAPVGVDLDSLDLAREWSERSKIRTVTELTMPPGGGPSDEERLWFSEWIDCGMPP